MFQHLILSAVIASIAVAGSAIAAGPEDIAARETLIQKFTGVYLRLSPTDPAKASVTLRLADLHAEKARLSFVQDMNSTCQSCDSGRADRVKALQYYNEVVEKMPKESQGKILTQVGHLYELNQEEAKAVAIYTKIISSNPSEAILAEAHLSLGEIHFKSRKFPEAISDFEKVLLSPKAPQKGLALYRQSWCQFNLGQIDESIAGLEKILLTPEFLSRSIETGNKTIDRQFQEEVSRDLATFYAKRTVAEGDWEKLFKFSPETTRLANLTFLAQEAERLGQTKQALSVWRFAMERQSDPRVRLEAHVHVAQLQMQQADRINAMKDFEAALILWGQIVKAEPTNETKELKARLKNFVLDWNKVEKKTPSPELLTAYQLYTQTFPESADMLVWTAQLAQQLKNYPLAISSYMSAAAVDSKLLESSLLNCIEVGELSQDKSLLKTVYEQYLSRSPEKKKQIEVQYQSAHLTYESGDYEKAAKEMHAIALSSHPGPLEMKKQAADLALDSLALLKDDERILNWANEFAKSFPEKKTEMTALGRKAILNKSLSLSGNLVDLAQINAAWKVLERFEAKDAESTEKISFYKNRLILAEKLNRFSDARECTEQLLRISELTEDDRNYVLSRKAWLAELVLDFDSALQATKLLKQKPADRPTALLKMAMYADLSAQDSSSFYQEFIKESKDSEKQLAAVQSLIAQAVDQYTEIKKHKTLLMQKPELYAGLLFDSYLKKAQPEIIMEVAASPVLKKTESGRIFQRIGLLNEYAKMKTQIQEHKIDSSNQKRLAQDLKKRIQLLNQTEQIVNRAVDSGDWTSQLVYLTLYGAESERFYQELLSLPMPVGLTPEQEQEYLQELSKQAAPHQVRAADIKKKTDEFWTNSNALQQLKDSFAKVPALQKSLVKFEIDTLSSIATDPLKADLNSALNFREPAQVLPDQASVELARKAVRENPLDRNSISQLLTLEKQLGRNQMALYLEGRLQSSESKENTK